jgi:hypothetical protein
MADPRVTIHSSAEIPMELLSPADRAKVVQGLQRLASRPATRWPRETVWQLNPDEPVYLLRLPGDLCVIFRVPAEGHLVIEDVFREQTLEQFVPKADEPIRRP